MASSNHPLRPRLPGPPIIGKCSRNSPPILGPDDLALSESTSPNKRCQHHGVGNFSMLETLKKQRNKRLHSSSPPPVATHDQSVQPIHRLSKCLKCEPITNKGGTISPCLIPISYDNIDIAMDYDCTKQSETSFHAGQNAQPCMSTNDTEEGRRVSVPESVILAETPSSLLANYNAGKPYCGSTVIPTILIFIPSCRILTSEIP
jgi:hypothetical protein